MKITKILLLCFAGVLLLGGGYYIYKKLQNKPEAAQDAQKVWQLALTENPKLQSFHYAVAVEGRADGESRFKQTATGDFQAPNSVSGTYHSDNYDTQVEREFILIDQTVYSKEGVNKKWFTWPLEGYPEAIYYRPTDLILETENSSFIKKEKINNQTVFLYEGNFRNSVRADDFGLNKISLWVSPMTGLIQKTTLAGAENQLDITKTIAFSNFDKKVTIEPPKDLSE